MRIDAETVARSEISTWRTDAGDIDVLSDIPAGHGVRQTYDDLLPRSSRVGAEGATMVVASLDDVIRSKEWATSGPDGVGGATTHLRKRSGAASSWTG